MPFRLELWDRFSARRAVPETGKQCTAAIRAVACPACRGIHPRLAGFVEMAAAASAFHVWAPFPDTKEGQKEDGKIVVHPLQAALIEPAGRAHAALALELYGLGLNPCDEKKHPFQSR